MNHTPGPWIAEGRFVYTSPTDAESCEMIARVGVMESKRNEADAKLIAAAPELLAALQRINRTSVRETFHGDVAGFQEWLDGFTAELIIKATE